MRLIALTNAGAAHSAARSLGKPGQVQRGYRSSEYRSAPRPRALIEANRLLQIERVDADMFDLGHLVPRRRRRGYVTQPVIER